MEEVERKRNTAQEHKESVGKKMLEERIEENGCYQKHTGNGCNCSVSFACACCQLHFKRGTSRDGDISIEQTLQKSGPRRTLRLTGIRGEEEGEDGQRNRPLEPPFPSF